MKRRTLWTGAVLLFVLAVAMGYGLCALTMREERTPDAPPAAVRTTSQTDSIEQFRTERQQLRRMQMEQLNEIVHGGSADAEMVAMAQRRQLELMEWSEQELTLEGVLRLREFEDVLVTVHTDSVNVMVRAKALNRQQTAVILELVMRETGISGGNVKIIPIN